MTKQEYHDTYNMYYRLPTSKLEKKVGELGKKRYEEYDASLYEEHRIACRVLIERKRDGEGLIFHLKNLIVRKSC
jgi:hypothetical protein